MKKKEMAKRIRRPEKSQWKIKGNMLISKKKWRDTEKRMADLEKEVQDLPAKIIGYIADALDDGIKAADSVFHIPEEK